jgi:hypothetical protein
MDGLVKKFLFRIPGWVKKFSIPGLPNSGMNEKIKSL